MNANILRAVHTGIVSRANDRTQLSRWSGRERSDLRAHWFDMRRDGVCIASHSIAVRGLPPYGNPQRDS